MTRRPAWSLAALSAGMFLVLFDVTVVNVALPDMRAALGLSVAQLQWVVDGYTVPLAALLLGAGSLVDRYGARALLIAGIALFGLASLGCALAQTPGVLIGFRVLQGIGAAALLPASQAGVAVAFPEPAEQARALGLWAGLASVALPAGPVIGGALVSAGGWPLVFWLNVPVTCVLATAAVVLLPGRGGRGWRVRNPAIAALGRDFEPSPGHNAAIAAVRRRLASSPGHNAAIAAVRRHLAPSSRHNGAIAALRSGQHQPRTTVTPDLPGAVLAAVALGALVLAVITVGHSGWTPAVTGSLAVCVVATVAFGLVEHRSDAPMLPLRLLASGRFVVANAVAGTMNLVGIGSVLVLTLLLQDVQGHDSTIAGLALLPLFVPLVLLSPVTGRLVGRYGVRVPMAAGLLTGAAGSACLLLVGPEASYVALLPVLVGLGTGMGLLTAAVVTAAVRAVPPHRAGLAGGVTNAARQAGGAVGIALYGAVAGDPGTPAGFLHGLHILGVLGAVAWALAAVATVWALGPGASSGVADVLEAEGVEPAP